MHLPICVLRAAAIECSTRTCKLRASVHGRTGPGRRTQTCLIDPGKGAVCMTEKTRGVCGRGLNDPKNQAVFSPRRAKRAGMGFKPFNSIPLSGSAVCCVVRTPFLNSTIFLGCSSALGGSNKPAPAVNDKTVRGQLQRVQSVPAYHHHPFERFDLWALAFAYPSEAFLCIRCFDPEFETRYHYLSTSYIKWYCALVLD